MAFLPRQRSMRTTFAELVAKCPVPVVIGPGRACCYLFRDCEPDEPPGRPGDPPAPYITLSNRGTLARRTADLLHEIGHHICHSSGCECFFDGGLGPRPGGLCEAHAYEFQLRKCLRLPAAHCEAVRLILRQSRGSFPAHRLGASMVLRSAAWPLHLRLASRRSLSRHHTVRWSNKSSLPLTSMAHRHLPFEI